MLVQTWKKPGSVTAGLFISIFSQSANGLSENAVKTNVWTDLADQCERTNRRTGAFDEF